MFCLNEFAFCFVFLFQAYERLDFLKAIRLRATAYEQYSQEDTSHSTAHCDIIIIMMVSQILQTVLPFLYSFVSIPVK